MSTFNGLYKQFFFRISYRFSVAVFLIFAAASLIVYNETAAWPGHTSAGTNTSIAAYPAWFLYPGAVNAETAIGFAMASFFEDQAAERAFSNGELAFRAQRGLHINYTTFWEQLPDDSFRMTGEEFQTDTLAAPVEDLYLADFATVNRMTLTLVSASEAITLQNNRVHPGPQPAWVSNPPASGEYAYAMGYSPVYYYEHESWKRAEISALKNMAQLYEVRHQRLVRSLNRATEAVTKQKSTVTARDIQVVERWRDERNSYVLLRARLEPGLRSD